MSDPLPPPPPLPEPVPPLLAYATPALNYAPLARNDLRQIAIRQKAIMYCILGYIILAVSFRFLPPPVNLVAAVAVIAVIITAAVFVFMLSMSVYNTAAGIVLGILTLIPIVGLLVLVIINGKATAILRAHGIKVGLMGANSRQIPGPNI